MEEHAAPFLTIGRLSVLEDWCDPFAVYFLYDPSRRQPTVDIGGAHRDAALIEPLSGLIISFLRDEVRMSIARHDLA
jgi:hypothetical protein